MRATMRQQESTSELGPGAVVVIVGTRPEAIKMAPVVRALSRRGGRLRPVVVTTAQHREMLDEMLDLFGIEPDIDLDLMDQANGLANMAALALDRLAAAIQEIRPDAVLVQGDTTTVASAALAAFCSDVPVGHVEAGLRSKSRRDPFPEEMHRRTVGQVADLHFAPTPSARQNLLRENIEDERIFVTGNTVVDALESIALEGPFDSPALRKLDFEDARILLLTSHRRENHGEPLKSICRAMRHVRSDFDDIQIVYPVHPNPDVRETAESELGGEERIHLIDPVGYRDLLRLEKRCRLILTDSGGIQEEAASFRTPVLVLRDTTERPELIESGLGQLVGSDPEAIVSACIKILSETKTEDDTTSAQNPFGDGRAADRIAQIMEDTFVAGHAERMPTRNR